MFGNLTTLRTFLVALLLAKELTGVDLVLVFVLKLGAGDAFWVLLFTMGAFHPPAKITLELLELFCVQDFAEIFAFCSRAEYKFFILTKSLYDGLIKSFSLAYHKLLRILTINKSCNHVLTQNF